MTSHDTPHMPAYHNSSNCHAFIPDVLNREGLKASLRYEFIFALLPNFIILFSYLGLGRPGGSPSN